MRVAAPRAGLTSLRAWPAVDRAIAVFAASAVATVAATLAQPAITPISPLPILVVIAAFCAAALLRRSAPSLAWIASIAGVFAAAAIPIGQARAASPAALGIGPWMGFAVPASVAAIVTLGLAAAYAVQPERRLGHWATIVALGLLGWLVVACLTTVGLIGTHLAKSDPDFTWIDVATVPITGFVPFVVAVTLLGAAGDVRAAARRAREGLGPVSGGATPGGSAERTWALAVATARELVPGQSAAGEATAAAERTRLAGDLHAAVLPGLRQAIAAVESGGDPETVARHLRSVDLELERVMADRWPVVLEAFGLIAALEDLAERVEADGRLAVQIDVGRAGQRPPVAIERVAWRVAQIAVDNAVRHAGAATIAITVSVDPQRVALAVADDGRGFDPDEAPVRRADGRGLLDARRRAESVGATIRFDTRPGGGTSVAFEWAARPGRPA